MRIKEVELSIKFYISVKEGGDERAPLHMVHESEIRRQLAVANVKALNDIKTPTAYLPEQWDAVDAEVQTKGF